MLEMDILPGYDGVSERKLRIAAKKLRRNKIFVIPAKAGIHFDLGSANVDAMPGMRKINMDPSLRWDDGFFCCRTTSLH